MWFCFCFFAFYLKVRFNSSLRRGENPKPPPRKYLFLALEENHCSWRLLGAAILIFNPKIRRERWWSYQNNPTLVAACGLGDPLSCFMALFLVVFFSHHTEKGSRSPLMRSQQMAWQTIDTCVMPEGSIPYCNQALRSWGRSMGHILSLLWGCQKNQFPIHEENHPRPDLAYSSCAILLVHFMFLLPSTENVGIQSNPNTIQSRQRWTPTERPRPVVIQDAQYHQALRPYLKASFWNLVFGFIYVFRVGQLCCKKHA